MGAKPKNWGGKRRDEHFRLGSGGGWESEKDPRCSPSLILEEKQA